MAINTIYMVLMFLAARTKCDFQGGIILIDAFVARGIIEKANKRRGQGIPYPLKNEEWLLPGGAKIGKYDRYYLKYYTEKDLTSLVKSLFD